MVGQLGVTGILVQLDLDQADHIFCKIWFAGSFFLRNFGLAT